jgi:Fibronectin type III domain
MRVCDVIGRGLLLVAACAAVNAAASSSVTLAWDPTPGVAGYRLYLGLASRTYSTMLDVGGSTTVTVANLVPGTTYYFAVTDYDTNHLESTFSGEISYTVPLTSGLTRLNLALLPLGQALLSGFGPVGYTYLVESSTDLVAWAGIGTVTNSPAGTFQILTAANPTARARYFRLRQTSP